MKKVLPLLVLVAAMMAVALSLSRERASAATGPCGTSSDANDAEETQFIGLLQTWRDSHVSPSSHLEVSGALNAAAAWFAQYQVTTGGNGGHFDNFGRMWNDRAYDCGYTGRTSFGDRFADGSGEGVYVVSSSQKLTIGPQDAIKGITYSYPDQSGVYISTTDRSLPAKCVGVAVVRNAAGTAVAWIAIIAQYPANQPCPGSTATGGGAGGSPSPSPSPTPSPTATPVPQANYGMTVTINMGWNLVYLPAGGLADILDTARQCFDAVYKPSGTGWLRYVPGAPAYVSNLQQSLGEAFWIEGTANCGAVGI